MSELRIIWNVQMTSEQGRVHFISTHLVNYCYLMWFNLMYMCDFWSNYILLYYNSLCGMHNRVVHLANIDMWQMKQLKGNEHIATLNKCFHTK